ncbi:MAG: hypothetical protein QM537_05265 [Candidatus Symbiobacter sp.]|nr:hypothetical protein [Candidatus Symbiobacter sp.]
MSLLGKLFLCVAWLGVLVPVKLCAQSLDAASAVRLDAVPDAQSDASSDAPSERPTAHPGPYPRDGVYAGFSIVNHIGAEGEFNPFAPELSVSYSLQKFDMRSISLMAGVYYNGEYRASIYGGARLDFDRYFDVSLGLVNGYLDDPVVPMAVFEVHPWPNLGVFFLPGAERVNGHLQFLPILGVRVRFNVFSFEGD